MPYTTVVAGTTITAAWSNANVRDQVVTPFANAAARTSAITSPVDGMIAYLGDVDWYERYKTSTGWQRLDWNDAWGTIGGKRWTAGGSALALGIAATESATNMDTGSVTLIAGRSYRFAVRFNYIPAAGGADTWQMRIRRTNVSGTQWGDWVFQTNQASFAMTAEFSIDRPDVGSTITDTWVLTAQRAGGPDALNINNASGSSPAHMLVQDMGPVSRITSV